MKYISILLLSLSLVLFSCASDKKTTLGFVAADGTNVMFVRPTEYKSGKVSMLSIDMTFYGKAQELVRDSVVNYSVSIKGFSASQIQNVGLSLKFGGNTIALPVKSVLSKTRVKDSFVVRFSSEVSIDDSLRLLNSRDSLFVSVEVEGETVEIPVKEFQERIQEISCTL